MGFDTVAGIVIVLALLVLLWGATILAHSGWWRGWLRGNAGLAVVGVSGAVAIFAFNVYRYQEHNPTLPMLTIGIEKLSDTRSRLTLMSERGAEFFKDIDGDHWEVSFRVVQWGSLATSFGLPMGYRMGTLQGMDANGVRQAHALSEPDLMFDAWSILEFLSVMPWIRTSEPYSGAVPLVDGGLFAIHSSATGLLVKPLNQIAEIALDAQRKRQVDDSPQESP